MQHGLLALAIALIFAIVAALFAPAYVDWNEWRATFERQASELAGAPVQIRGPIEAAILPVPEFILRDVRIGDPEQSTGIRAGEVKGTLSLGALLRGAFEAEEFVLVRPEIRVAVEEGGRIVLPIGGTKAPDELAISRFSIVGGSLTLHDLASQSLTYFDGISADGEMFSRAGPLRLDANMRLDGRRWNLRASMGAFGADGARTRLTLERSDDGASLDADGFLNFSSTAPRFNGKLNLAQAKGKFPWKAAANASVNGDLITLEAFELTAGAGETPLEFTGHLQFVARTGGKIDGTLSAKRLDLDRALNAKVGNGLIAITAPLRDSFDPAAILPFVGKIGFDVDLLIANGAQVRDLHGEIGFREGMIGLQSFEAKLPGRATLRASGLPKAREYFRGDVKLEADDPLALARWIFGPQKDFPSEETGRFSFAGFVDWSRDELSVEGLGLALGDAIIHGAVAVKGSGERSVLKTSLFAERLDLDLLNSCMEALPAVLTADEISLNITGKSLRWLKKRLPSVVANITRSPDGISVQNFSVTDFDGLTVSARGKISNSDPLARLEFSLDAVSADGLAAIVERVGGTDLGIVVNSALRSAMPLSLSGGVQNEGDQLTGVAVGKFSGMPANINVQADKAGSIKYGRLKLEARDSAKFLSMLGIPPGPSAPGDSKLELEILAQKAGAFPLQAHVSVPGASLSVSGEIQKQDDRLEPRLELKLEATDLRPAVAAALRASEDAIQAKGSAKISRVGDSLGLDIFSLEIGKTRASGQIFLANIEKPEFSGRLALDQLELGRLIALTAASSVRGTLAVDVATLSLTDAPSASAAKFKLDLGDDVEISGFAAEMAGGKITGEGRITRGAMLAVDGRASLNGFEIARLLVSDTAKATARGKGDLSLSFSGSGTTPTALVSKLSGQGMLALENLELDALDPLAIATVVSAAEKHMPKDESHLLTGVNSMLARAPLKLAKLEMPLITVNGTVRTGKVMAKVGNVDVKGEASFDLARMQVNAAAEMDMAGMTNARPGLTVRWQGPFASPIRAVDVSALSTAINLRAMERETKRLGQRDRTALPPMLDEADPSQRIARGSSARADEDIRWTPDAARLPKSVKLPPLRPE